MLLVEGPSCGCTISCLETRDRSEVDKGKKAFDLVYCELPLPQGVILASEAAPVTARLLQYLSRCFRGDWG